MFRKKSKGYVAVPLPGGVIWGETAAFLLILGFFPCKTGKVKLHLDSVVDKTNLESFL